MDFLSQIEAGAKAAESILAGKSELFISAVLLVGFVGWTMFQQNKQRKDADERHEKRETEEKARQATRETEDQKRHDEQNQFHRDMALRNADQLDAMTASLERTSRATEIMATCAERIDTQLASLTIAQKRDRRAIISVIDASEAKTRGEDDAASMAIKEARKHLIGAEE